MSTPYTTKLIRRAAETAKKQLRLRTISTWASAFRGGKDSAWVLSVVFQRRRTVDSFQVNGLTEFDLENEEKLVGKIVSGYREFKFLAQ